MEWEELWYRTRPKLLEEIAAAAAQGDRSENAEYIYGKTQTREIDRRLRQLDDKIGKCVVMEGAQGIGDNRVRRAYRLRTACRRH